LDGGGGRNAVSKIARVEVALDATNRDYQPCGLELLDNMGICVGAIVYLDPKK
jgi:hypothetical protein